MVKNIRFCPIGILVHGHHGSSQAHYYGDVDGIKDWVWLDPNGLENILSQSKLSQQYCICYDNWRFGECFYVFKGDGTALVFCARLNGLHVHDTQDYEIVQVTDLLNEGVHVGKIQDQGVSLVETVEENKLGMTKKQIVGANAARCLYSMVGQPSIKDFKGMITSNMLRNFPITTEDVDNAEKLYGPDVGALKGKTVQKGLTTRAHQYCTNPRDH